MIKPHLAPPHPYCFVFKDFDFAYMGVPKCGSASIRDSLKAQTAVFTGDVKCKTRMAVIRHPIARLLSAWQYAWKDVPFKDWWDHVRREPHFDIHTMHYMDLLEGNYTHIHRLEEIHLWWPEYAKNYPMLFPELPLHINKRRTVVPDKLPLDDIMRVYKKDFILWRSLGPTLIP